MRRIAFCVSPVSAAINRVLQCVLLAGIVSKVFVITPSTCASVIVRGGPGRGSSNSPSSRCRRNRSRQLQTEAAVIPSRVATTPAAVWFAYSPDRKGSVQGKHLETYAGILQADGYGVFNKLYETGRIMEAACWAHVRRKFHDLYQAHRSPIAKEALERIVAVAQGAVLGPVSSWKTPARSLVGIKARSSIRIPLCNV